GRRGAPGRRHCRAYYSAGAGSTDAEPGVERHRFAALNRTDARRRAGGDTRHRQGRRHECGTAGGGHPGRGPSRAEAETPRIARGAGCQDRSGNPAMRIAFVAALCAGLLAAQELATRMDDAVKSIADNNRKFMGSVLVAKDGKVILSRGYGFANLEWEIPNA